MHLSALTNDRSAAVLHHPPLDALIAADPGERPFRKTVQAIRPHRFTDPRMAWPARHAAYPLFLAGIPRRTGVGSVPHQLDPGTSR